MERKKINILPASIVTLVVLLIIIHLWISKDHSKIQSSVNEIKDQKTNVVLTSTFLEKIPRPSDSSVARSAITVTKPLPKEKPVKIVENEILKTQGSKRTPPPSAHQAVASGSNTISEESISGITKDSKRPSPEKIKEMNERGIIIW
ncbi:MAG: hypothetical protein WCX16_01010 [Candidatus Omnitrophota bacterium]